ncbi:MAG: tRNA preQ1(34) S-adenosylmethionine ribosyltransferase-isomerase QueA, partial [Clostridia bacterium]|nr:tRNA preQ1(34) S-adenosylmethionine ribosyltransferase-isomerase QueA [Clostridia bacterium]
MEKGFQLKDYYYDLPENLIAQTPLKDRSSSRLMVLDRKQESISHKHFTDVLSYLKEGDCLVLNDTRVLPARLYGVKEETGAHVEVVLLKRLTDTRWEVMTRPGKKTRPGAKISFGDGSLRCTVDGVAEDGLRTVDFEFEGIFEEVLDKLGQMPLPPYITEKLEDKNRYQTVYAKNNGSAAAPTAGLHFTPELLKQIEQKGVKIAYLTLHVGLGTFRPVKVEDITTHKMHSEFYEITQETADIINETKKNG